MRKNYFFRALGTLILCFFFLYPCSAQHEFDYLEVNNIKAYINPLNLFSKDGNASFEVPKGSGKHTIYNANIWLGGMTDGGNLHVAAHLYGENGQDFFLGPITNDYTVVDGKKVVSEAYKQKYFRTWKVSKAEIDYHKANYSNSSYQMPWAIANWPAHGRTQFGESTNLAPYKKVSSSSTYNPAQGDYPDILGDEAVLFIINDALNVHTESGGEPLGVEIVGMAYAFIGPDQYGHKVDNTVFIQYVIKNKSPRKYKDFYFGFFADFDLGYKYDDYIGCDVFRNLAYIYNGKEIDGSGEFGAYGAMPPAQGSMFLSHDMHAFLFFNYNASPTGTPDVASDYYNYMRAVWKDGTPMTRYGIGYNLGSTDYANFMFERGTYLDPTGTWSEEQPTPYGTPNQPGDRRSIMSTGPFTLFSGRSLTIDIALPYGRAEEGGAIASVQQLLVNSDEARLFWSNLYTGIGGRAVYQNQYPPLSGDVLLYSVQSAGQYTLCKKNRLTRNGFYHFDGVADGNYIVKVIPHIPDNLLPTYYGNMEHWSEATVITIANGVSQSLGDIMMIPTEPLGGSSTISGYVNGISGGKKSILSSKVSNPVPDASVYLQTYQENKWKTIAHTLTNKDGYFVFKSVPIGSYRLTLDVPGIEITDTPTVEITEDGQIVDNIIFETTIGIAEIIKKSGNNIVVYPNPSNGHFTMVSENVIERIELYDVLGKKVFSDIPKTQTVQLNTHLPQGLYIYRAVLQGGSVSSGKIVVQ